MKLTIVYEESWTKGSQYYSCPRFIRVEKQENETFGDLLVKLGIENCFRYIFKGWPAFNWEDEDKVHEFLTDVPASKPIYSMTDKLSNKE